jgi:hypothetical protein
MARDEYLSLVLKRSCAVHRCRELRLQIPGICLSAIYLIEAIHLLGCLLVSTESKDLVFSEGSQPNAVPGLRDLSTGFPSSGAPSVVE